MDKIKKYLEFVFSDFKTTSRVSELKEEIQTNLIEKMNDYIAEGMSEEEASLKAIGSLGNIEDVLKEIGVELNQSKHDEIYLPIIEEAINDRKRRFNKGSIWISIGVFLCILAVGFASVDSSFNNAGITLVLFFVPIIVAIPMFIIAGVTYFNVDEKEIAKQVKIYHDHDEFKHYVNSQRRSDQRREVIGAVLIGLGIALCLVGIMLVSIYESANYEYLTLIFFLFIGAGVVCFIQAGMRCFAVTTKNYTKSMVELEQLNDESSTKGSRVMMAIDGIMFPLMAISYVGIGLFINSNWWSIGWIVFPIYAIISGGIKGIVKATNAK